MIVRIIEVLFDLRFPVGYSVLKGMGYGNGKLIV